MQFRLARAGTNIRLGQELGRGGEGVVYSVEGEKSLAAKIYAKSPGERTIQKLGVMAQATNTALQRIAAWPIDTLLNASGNVQGFVMPAMGGRRDVHELYGPKSRADSFPEADFKFIVHVSANVARAFAVIHEHGHVVGDVNHGNILVSPDGTVVLIDCDSFQVGAGTNAYTCDVGVPLFTAPELQGQSFRGLLRTPEHDLFGLAVLLFHLLYMGRHPFAGRYTGSGEMPIERAILENRFAYGPRRAAYGMERPPNTIPLETMGAQIAEWFTRAFAAEGTDGGRPDARTWIKSLEDLKINLRICQTVSNHQYPRTLHSCPWCEMESRTGARLFGQRIVPGGPSNVVDLGALWIAIAAVKDPGGDPLLPSERSAKLSAGVKIPNAAFRKFRRMLSVGLIVSGLVACNTLTKGDRAVGTICLYGLAFAIWPRVSAKESSAAHVAYANASAEWQRTLSQWKTEASRNRFVESLKTLEVARAGLAGLSNERRQRFAQLDAQRESQQRRRYLDRFRIERGNVHGIGPGRTSMLASYGIETAADIDRQKILKIPGFGGALAAELVKWKEGHEKRFRFNASEPINPRDVDELERELRAREQSLLSTLRQGPSVLGQLSRDIATARLRLMPFMERAWQAFKIAEAHRDAL